MRGERDTPSDFAIWYTSSVNLPDKEDEFMPILTLVRHGQSQWNLENRFTGWVDVPLSEKGIDEAKQAGLTLKGLHFDRAFTSKLKRSQNTLKIILEQIGQTDLPIEIDQALNERHYVALQGLDKKET